jgi:cell division septation protein DedD
VDRIRGNGYEFVLHFDVDVIADFQATNYPGSGGLTLEEVRDALMVFARQKHLAAMEVTAYNPSKDGDGGGAKLIIDLLAEVFAARLEAVNAASTSHAAPVSSAAQPPETKSAAAGATPAHEAGDTILSTPQPGEAWSSDSLDTENDDDAGASGSDSHNTDPSESPETDGSPS